VVAKIMGDFEAKGVDVQASVVEAKIAEFDMLARKEILSEI
jgi:hypothetical protein